MGMTATEKVLARASGAVAVRAGETIYPDPELVIVHDGYIASCKTQLDERRIHRLFDPKRVMFVTDHAVVYTNAQFVERGAAIRRAVRVPVVGVIEPGARAALAASAGGRVGVIGTEATVKSRAYPKALKALSRGVRVESWDASPMTSSRT